MLHAHLIAHRINQVSESRFPFSTVSRFKQFFVAVLAVGVASRTKVALSQDCIRTGHGSRQLAIDREGHAFEVI